MSHGEPKHSVKQDIKGSGHQIAGRDLINEGDGFKPDPKNPNLRQCNYCEWLGLAIDAHVCQKCGHNYLADALAKQAEAHRKSEDFKALLIAALLVALLGAMQLAHWLKLNLGQGIIAMLALLGLVWWLWVYASVRLKFWRAQRTRKKKGWDD